MKEWSNQWKSSIKPRKQRKYVLNAPLHTRNNFMKTHISKELRGKYKMRNIRVRKGDIVKILRGSFKGMSGKINKVDLKLLRVFIDGIVITKRDGTKALYPLHPSNVIITELETSDHRRLNEVNKQ